jgi:hypothetical protein
MRKYHSGWMWTGVTRGLAGIKFSGSPKTQGAKKQIKNKEKKKQKNPNKSFNLKYGWKLILSKFLLTPRGFLLPV